MIKKIIGWCFVLLPTLGLFACLLIPLGLVKVLIILGSTLGIVGFIVIGAVLITD